jgi:hypothetical protein
MYSWSGGLRVISLHVTALMAAGCAAVSESEPIDDPARDDDTVVDPDRPELDLPGDDSGKVANQCRFREELGVMTDLPMIAERRNQPGSMGARHVYRSVADIGPRDQLVVELWEESGSLLGRDIEPGRFEITDQDTSILDCGVCVLLLGDIDPATGFANQIYMAQSGTVSLKSLAPMFSSAVLDAEFVELDRTTDQIADSACISTVTEASSSALLKCYGGGGGGTGDGSGGQSTPCS